MIEVEPGVLVERIVIKHDRRLRYLIDLAEWAGEAPFDFVHMGRQAIREGISPIYHVEIDMDSTYIRVAAQLSPQEERDREAYGIKRAVSQAKEGLINQVLKSLGTTRQSIMDQYYDTLYSDRDWAIKKLQSDSWPPSFAPNPHWSIPVKRNLTPEEQALQEQKALEDLAEDLAADETLQDESENDLFGAW